MYSQILKKTLTIGSATLVSRIFGFVRDVLIAFFFGTQDSAQAFVVAFRLPNIWRSFIGEEAVNAAVVPVLSEYQSRAENRKFWELSYSLLKFAGVSLSFLALAGVMVAPWLVKLIAPGFSSSLTKYSLCVSLTRFIFPYILLVGITAVAGGIAVSQKIFWSYSWAPVVLNLVIISSLLLLGRIYGVYALAGGIILGGILEVILQFLALKKSHPSRLRSSIIHPEFKKIGRLLIPRFCGAGIYQINIFVDTILASLENIVGYGGIAALYYAQRFVQLPLAIFATSLATAILPFFSQTVANKTLGKLGENISLSLRSVFFVMLPACLGLMVLAPEIISTFFQYGKFSTYSTEITSKALQFYALGLVFYAGIKILVSTFYSLQDTFTPVKVSLVSLFINIGLSLLLMFPLGLGGLCLATSITAGCNFMMLFWALKKRVALKQFEIFKSFLKTLSASLLMAVSLIAVKSYLGWIFKFKGLNLLGLLSIAIVTYLGGSLIFNFGELNLRLKWRQRK